jgi:Gpi18-like mannosyltransferase
MKIAVFRHKLRIGLFLILAASILLCAFSVWKARGDAFQSNDLPPAGHAGWHKHSGHRMHQAHPGQKIPASHPMWRNGGNPSPDGKHFFGNFRGANSDSTERTCVFLYSLLFLGAFAFACDRVFRKKGKIAPQQQKALLWSLLGAGLCLRVALAPWVGGQSFDLNLFKSWALAAAENFSGFYLHGSSDYPPLYIYILYLVGKAVSLPALGSYFTLLIKLPSIAADLLTAALLYRLAAKHLSVETGLLLSAFYLFSPAVFINSTFWGQVDSFFTWVVVVAVWLLTEKRVYGSAALFAAAVLMKPQGIIFLPVLLFELVRLKSVKRFFIAAFTALATALVIILPFSFRQSPLWIVKLFAGTIGEYPYASVNAYNFFSLIGANYKPDTTVMLFFSYYTWGMIFIVLITLFTGFLYYRGRSAKHAFLAALIQIAGVFTFSVSMHERYLFPAVALSLLAFIFLKDKRLLWLSVGLSATSFINTATVLYGMTRGGVPYNVPMFLTSLLNVVLFIFLAKAGWDLAAGTNKKEDALRTK